MNKKPTKTYKDFLKDITPPKPANDNAEAVANDNKKSC